MTSSTVRPGPARALLSCACAAALLAAPVSAALTQRAFAQEAASAVQDVALQDLALTFGDTKVSAPSVTVSGTRLSKDDLLAIFKADAKEPWPARLARLDAGSLTAPELRVERTIDGARQIAIYRNVAAKGIHAGRIAEFAASGTSLSVEGGSAGGGKGSYGKIRADDFDLAALARLYGEAGDGKGALQRVYASFLIEDIAFGDDGTTVKIARLSGRDFAGRQIPATWSGALAAFGAVDMTSADPVERGKAGALAADILDAVSVGSFEATGLSIKVSKDEPGELGLERIAYGGTGTDPGLTLSGFSFTAAGTQVRVAGIKLAGFSLQPTIAALRHLAKGGDASGAELRRLTPVIGTLTLTDIGVDIPRDDVPKPDDSKDPLGKAARNAAEAAKSAAQGETQGATLHFGLREASMNFSPPKDGIPVAARLAFSGITLPASAVAGAPGLGSLGLYGYRDLDFDLVADTAWDEGSQELALREIALSGKDMGSVRISGTLGGVGPDVFDPDTAVSSYAMLAATAKSLDLKVANSGLFERFIDAQSKSLSLKPEQLRQEYVTASVIGVPVILGSSPAAKAIGAAMGKFVTKPGTLTISARAKNGAGVGIVDFSTAPTPAAVLDKLEVNAKSE